MKKIKIWKKKKKNEKMKKMNREIKTRLFIILYLNITFKNYILIIIHKIL